MITDADVKKLIKEFKKIFPTKDELKQELSGLKTEINGKIDVIYTNLAESIGNILFEVKEVKDELKNHSKKIKKLENVRIN